MSRRAKVLAFVGVLSGFGLTAAVYDLGFDVWPPMATLSDGTSTRLGAWDVQRCFKASALALFGDRSASGYWQTCRGSLVAYHAMDAFDLRSTGVVTGGVVGLLALFGFALCVRLEKPPLRVVRGSRLHSGRAGEKAFAKACAQECRAHGHGIALLPPFELGRDRETRHFLILGSVGGGKTQTILHMIVEAIARNDSVLVLDTKGDMMAGLPGTPRPLFVAPHDRRSLVWNVARDCTVKQDARELAARFIPPSSDPMWSHAAQEVFVACIVHLQVTKGMRWGWSDLEAVVTADVATLTAHAINHNPNALRILAQPESKTTLSILTTFQTHMRIVSILAEAWRDSDNGGFSVRDWLHNPTPRLPLILQQDPGFPELSHIWIGSMLGLLASAVGSPTLAESRDRRTWLFLDEFPQLPPIKQFPTFLELGRSKGVTVVIGAQDIAQIRAAYGPDQAKSWFGMVGTKIITRINTSDAAEDISRLIGEQEVERPVRSATRSGGRLSVTESIHRETRRVVTASELASRLGPTDRGVKVLFVGLEDAVYELELPYLKLPALRESIVPADWTLSPPSPPDDDGGGTTPPALRGLLSEDLANRIRQIRSR
jgi:hypothetical protein